MIISYLFVFIYARFSYQEIIRSKHRKQKEKVWEGHHVVRKLTQTKEHGRKKRTRGSQHTSKLMAKAAGDLSPKPPAFFGVAKAAVSGGSTISGLT